jgi:hypothetical protein
MSLLNYTTSIKVEKTVGEIQGMLAAHGAQFCTVGYDEGQPMGISFVYLVNGSPCNFKLPCHVDGVLAVMEKDRNVPRRLCCEEQAYRVAWRIVKSWVAAQLAFVEAEQAKMEQVFLPYALLQDGMTLFQQVEGSPKLLQSGLSA